MGTAPPPPAPSRAGTVTPNGGATTPRKSNFGGVVVFLLVGLVVVFLFQLWNSTQDPADLNDNSSTAVVACEGIVKQNLKSPSTAKFDSDAGDTGERTWEVVGVVDSQNAFGATVRSKFACTVEVSAKTAVATLLYLNE